MAPIDAEPRFLVLTLRTLEQTVRLNPKTVGTHLQEALEALAPRARSRQRFLQTLEARDLPAAESLLAPEFRMEFPGGKRFTSLQALVSWAGGRYRFARKDYDWIDALRDGADIVVYCAGTLSGEWLDGEPFAGIRFIDRFLVRDGKLADQKVWNDLAEVRR